jgi:asparagine synthase (glutamine-hydrolysing)
MYRKSCPGMSTTSCKELRCHLGRSVQRNYADALLLSGGLDSSILACIAKPKVSFTVSLGDNAPDVEYARRVAAEHSREHIVVKLTYEKLLEIIEEVVKVLRTFSPLEIRNSSVVLAGIKAAMDKGYRNIMTGDGGDELFAGYNYLSRYYADTRVLDKELRKLWKSMHFSSLYLGKITGLAVKTPFLDVKFLSYAKSIQTVEKIGEYQALRWGKFILRKCYESDLGEEIAWRPKLAQEEGAGTTNIRSFISRKLDDRYFTLGEKNALSESTKIRDKEHLYYYLLYRKYFSAPKDEACDGHPRCPECKGCFTTAGQFCRICGSFPVKPESDGGYC